MGAISFVLLLLLLPAVLFALNWRVQRIAGAAEPEEAEDVIEDPDLMVKQVAAAERLRRDADAATDPAEKTSLTRLADEAEADIARLKNVSYQRPGDRA